MKKSSLKITMVNPKNGGVSYEDHAGYTFTATTSDNHEVSLFVYKQDNGTWNATEPRSTANVVKAGTRKRAIELAQSRIGSRTLEEFNEAVERVSNYKKGMA